MLKCFSAKKLVKISIAGVLFAVIDQAFGALVWGYLFADQINIPGLWRDMNSFEVKTLPPLGSLIMGLGIACLLSKIPLSEKCNCPYMRGLCVGFKIFLIAGLANSIMWYAYSPIPKAVFNASVVHHLLSFVIGTAILSKIVGDCCSMMSCSIEEKPAKNLKAKRRNNT